MKDRVPVNPGRVLITPENGNPAYYATMTRADNPTQEGTPINKNTLLKDATAAKFGLGGDAVPDEALNMLSRLHAGLANEYIWEKIGLAWAEVYSASTKTENLSLSATMRYSDAVENSNGTAVLVNPQTTTLNNAASHIGKYFSIDGQSFGVAILDNFYASAIYGDVTYRKVSFEQQNVVQYVNSPNPNAYPPAEDDEYTYQALGKLGEKVRIATGSYTGTNTYGSSNPCSLTFGFKPKLVIISGYMGRGTGSASSANASAVLCPDISGKQNYAAFDNSNRLYNDSMGGQITVSVSGNTISWYSTNNATEQMNYNARVYYYVAIG